MSEKLDPKQLTLYYLPTCPFCIRVFDVLKGMNFTPDLGNADANGITLKDIKSNPDFRDELIAGGGKKTSPCLRINRDGDIQWMYESLDIIAFLKGVL